MAITSPILFCLDARINTMSTTLFHRYEGLFNIHSPIDRVVDSIALINQSRSTGWKFLMVQQARYDLSCVRLML